MMERRVDRDAMESASREVSAGARQLAAKRQGGGWTGREREAHVRGFVERHQGAVLLGQIPMVELAAALGIPLNTAWNRLRLARSDLRAAWRRAESGDH